LSDEVESVDELRPTEALINGGLHPAEFEATLKAWLTNDADLRGARRRFLEGFRQGRSYNTERLVGAANAFDLLPDKLFMGRADLAPSIDAFLRDLEYQVIMKSEEDDAVLKRKDQLLGSLGRIRASSLQAQIISRYDTLAGGLKDRLPGMEDVIRCCVRVRNYFVHNTRLRLSPEAAYELAPFLTDSLEFVFATSGLQSCGWNVQRWVSESFSTSRLKWYLHNYKENRKRLRDAGAIIAL
jgi:hypothetical protein